MNRSFEKSIDEFIMYAINDSIQNLRESDQEYHDLVKRHLEEYERVEDIRKNLSTKDKDFIEHFEDEIFEIEAIEQSCLYVQGYKDCVKLLRFIEAI